LTLFLQLGHLYIIVILFHFSQTFLMRARFVLGVSRQGPTHLAPTHLPTYPPTHLLPYPTLPTRLPTYPPTHTPTYYPSNPILHYPTLYPPNHLPSTHLPTHFPPTHPLERPTHMNNKEVVREKDGTRFVEIQARCSTHMVLLGLLMSMQKWGLFWPSVLSMQMMLINDARFHTHFYRSSLKTRNRL